jgi:hypothetical protein
MGARCLAAQNDSPPPDRDAAKAAMFGALVPGAGHLYAGETLRGLGLFGVVAVDAATAIAMYNQIDCPHDGYFCDQQQRDHDVHRWIADTIVLGATVWIISAIDAPRAVRRRIAAQNARRRSASGPGVEWKLFVDQSPTASRSFRLGAQAAW